MSARFLKKASNFWLRMNVFIFYPSPRMICPYPVRISKSLFVNSDLPYFLSVADVLGFILILK